MPLFYLAFGAAFGFVLSRSGATDYQVIQEMFLFQDIQLYGIIGTAVAVIAPGLWLLKRRGRTLSGEPLVISTTITYSTISFSTTICFGPCGITIFVSFY